MSKERRAAFTKEQQKIIETEEYPFCLTSVAGSGKTEIIAERIIRLVDQGVGLDEIAIITFTNKATAEMRDRLADKLLNAWQESGNKNSVIRKQMDTIQMADISTIHSFCQRLLNEYGMEIGIAPNFTVSGFRYESDKIIEAAIREHYERELFKDIPTYKIKEIVKELYKHNTDKGIRFEPNSIEFESSRWGSLAKLIIAIYITAVNHIEKEKKRRNILTQNDLISEAARMLENGKTAALIARKYKYIYIDEMQDTNQEQMRLAAALQANGVKLFVAGDDRQSIYAFRGADVQSFRSMAEQSRKYILDENFRARPGVINFINRLFTADFYCGSRKLRFTHSPLKAIRSEPDKEPGVIMNYCMDLADIIRKLSQRRGGLDTVCYNDNIGVLCRNNRELSFYARQLKKAGIPVKMIGGRSFYQQDSVVDTFKILNALVNKGVIEENETLFTDYYNAFCSNDIESDKEQRFYKLLAQLRDELRGNSIARFLRILYDATDVIEFYEKLWNEQDAANLRKLADIARQKHEDGMQPTDFVRYLDRMMSSRQDEDAAELGTDKADDAVVVTTIHRAKGLSYNVVIVPRIESNLTKHLRPRILFDQDKGQIAINHETVADPQKEEKPNQSYEGLYEDWMADNMEEELRVLFVAMTRAKNLLILGTEKSKSKIEYRMSKDASYISWYRWLYERDKGKLLKEIEQ